VYPPAGALVAGGALAFGRQPGEQIERDAGLLGQGWGGRWAVAARVARMECMC
jgi:hypothetical protein